MDVREYNRRAWDKQVAKGNVWTRAVSPQVITDARRGDWSVLLTEERPAPREWFGDIRGKDILCLASGGGQQGPVLAAAGARVTVFDNSPRQLAQDRLVAEREGLDLTTIEGDARDLSILADQSFDLVFHPVSNVFFPAVRPVWREVFRVLRRGGALLAGFMNPAFYLFTSDAQDGKEPLIVVHSLPYADTHDLSETELEQLMGEGIPLEYSHSLSDQIGGQLDAGLLLTAMYETRHSEAALGRYMQTYIATRAIKP